MAYSLNSSTAPYVLQDSQYELVKVHLSVSFLADRKGKPAEYSDLDFEIQNFCYKFCFQPTFHIFIRHILLMPKFVLKFSSASGIDIWLEIHNNLVDRISITLYRRLNQVKFNQISIFFLSNMYYSKISFSIRKESVL